jgi:hypothetical protein
MSNTRVVELLVVDPETVLKGASSVGSVAIGLAIPLVNPDIKEARILRGSNVLGHSTRSEGHISRDQERRKKLTGWLSLSSYLTVATVYKTNWARQDPVED